MSVQSASRNLYAEALERLRPDLPFDLVITDQVMPAMTGVQLAAAIKLVDPRVPILLVSGYAELAPGEVGSLSLLRKPFDQAALATAIAELLAASNVVPLRIRKG